MAFHLRVLSGKHKGAEIRLSARRYSLGSSEDNVVILSDDDIEKNHITFFFSEGEVSVLSAHGGLMIDGKKINSFPLDVAPLQLMTLAGSNENDNVSLAFAEGTAANWPDDKKIAETLARGANAAENKTKDEKTRRAEKKFGSFARLSPRKRKILLRSGSRFAVALGASIAIIFISLLWQDPARRQAKRMQQVEQQLERELASKPREHRTVYIKEANDGSIILLGYVETEKELVRLRGIAFESGLRIRVVSKEQLRATLKVFAKQYGLYANFVLLPIAKNNSAENKKINAETKQEKNVENYNFEKTEQDTMLGDYESTAEASKAQRIDTQYFKLRVEGFIEHERRVETFRQAVIQDLPYIVEVEMDVTTNEIMLGEIQKTLAKNAAFSGIKLELISGYLVISGAIFSNFHDELQTVLKKHSLKLPNAPIIKEKLILVPPLYAQITALLLGRQRAVDLRIHNDRNSKRYLIGETIDSDKQITDIANNGIMLKYKNETVGFPISSILTTIPDAPNPALE